MYTALKREVKWMHCIHKCYIFIYILEPASPTSYEALQLNPVGRLNIPSLSQLTINDFNFPDTAESCMFLL